MSGLIIYLIIASILVVAELVYFKIADMFNIIDKPNERSSHSNVVLRGGGVIFSLSMIVWFVLMLAQGKSILDFFPFMCGLILIAGVSFWDDVQSLPDSVRLVVQFMATGLMFWSIVLNTGGLSGFTWYGALVIGIVALIVFVGATDIINFMDGINGITAGYAFAILFPLLLLNRKIVFIEESYLVVAIIGVLVFSFFNFREKGKAKCFAGDVGSISMAFIMLFAIGNLINQTGDITWLIFLLVYGVDGVCTIFHRILLHEKLGVAHRKHAYQLMANELGMSHVVVSLIYMTLQMVVSIGFIYLCPASLLAHWIYLICVGAILVGTYLLFMKNYYHLHEEYLNSLK